MSIETWRKVYYARPATDIREDEAVQHSLTKWKGLRPGTLAEHGVVRDGRELMDLDGAVFQVDSSTCALCVHHYIDHRPGFQSSEENHCCSTCPLSIARGGVPCDIETEDEGEEEEVSPYHCWDYEGDPEPMIIWLEKAMKP